VAGQRIDADKSGPATSSPALILAMSAARESPKFVTLLSERRAGVHVCMCVCVCVCVCTRMCATCWTISTQYVLFFARVCVCVCIRLLSHWRCGLTDVHTRCTHACIQTCIWQHCKNFKISGYKGRVVLCVHACVQTDTRMYFVYIQVIIVCVCV